MRRTIGMLRVFMLGSASLMCFAAQPAAAADEAAAVAEDSGEIVVTARYREEKLQDVPLAITALSANTLEEANVRNLRDVAYLTPGLVITSGGSEFGVNPIIRGQTNLNGGGGDPNVPVFFDGVYVQNSTAITVGLIDVERIEVVKGPVSSLYGRNAFAGAINYVSKTPSLTEMSGNVSAFAGNDGQYSVSGSISAPLSDILAVRLAAGYEHFGGSYQDQVNGRKAGGFEKRDVQATVYFVPTPEFSAKGTYYYGDDTFGLSAIAYNANNCGSRAAVISAQDPSGLGFSQFCGRFDPDAHPVEVPNIPAAAGGSGNDRQVNLGSLKLAYDSDFGTFTSLTGYTKVTQQRYTDFIGRRNGIPFLLTPSGTTINLFELFGSNSNNRDFSQEVRFASDASKSFRFQAGGFYYKAKQFNTTIVGIGGAPLPAGQSLLPGFPADSYSPNSTLSTTRVTQARAHDRQTSGFIGAEYDLLEALTVSGEYRYTNQKKDQLIIRNTGCPSTITVAAGTCTGPAPTPYLFPNGTTPVEGTFKFSNYRGTLKYQATSNTNVYASIANGDKAGGFNQRATVPADLAYDPETNTTYEVGIKNSLFDNKLQLNIAAYHIDTKGIQISGPSANAANPGLVVKNFGSVKTDGFEVELAAKVAQGVRLNVGVGYSDPEFGKDAFDFGAAGPCATSNLTTGVITPIISQCAGRVTILPANSQFNGTNLPKAALRLNGLSVPRQADLQFTTGVDLDGAINDDWTWKANFNARYESKYYAFNNNISYYGPRTILNAQVGVQNETFSVSAYVNNLTNDHTPEIVSVNARLSDFAGDLDGYLPIGRQFGIKAGVKF